MVLLSCNWIHNRTDFVVAITVLYRRAPQHEDRQSSAANTRKLLYYVV